MSKNNYDEVSEASCGKKNGNTSAASGNAQYANSTSSKIMKKEDPVASTSGQYKLPYSVITRSKVKKFIISSKTHYSRNIDRQSDNSLQHQATSAAMPDNTKSMSGKLSESQELGNQSSSISQKEINIIKFETSNQPPDYSQVVVVVSEASNQPPDYSQEVVVVSDASNQPSNKLPNKLPNQPLEIIKDIKYQSHPANLFHYFNGPLSVSALNENRDFALQLQRKSFEDIREIHNGMKDQTDPTVLSSCQDHKEYHQNLIKRIEDREKEIDWWTSFINPIRNYFVSRILDKHFPGMFNTHPALVYKIFAILRTKEALVFLHCKSKSEYITNVTQWARIIETDMRMRARNHEGGN